MDQPSQPACLNHLIQMVSNFFDAHTAALLMANHDRSVLRLTAWETLSPHLVPGCEIKTGQGLIGWVAKEGKNLHVTRFSRDTKTLGIYSEDAHIKAFLAAPLPGSRGVIMVDSKNRYAFPEKKQRILNNCAQVALVLYSSLVHEEELNFYRACHQWMTTEFPGPESALNGLLRLLGMRSGLVIFKPNNIERLEIAALIHPAGTGKFKKGMIIKQMNGLAAWILAHKQGILLDRPGADHHKSFILYPDEPIERGSVVVGLFQPARCGSFAWILTGDKKTRGLPKGVLDLLAANLKARFFHMGSDVKAHGARCKTHKRP